MGMKVFFYNNMCKKFEKHVETYKKWPIFAKIL